MAPDMPMAPPRVAQPSIADTFERLLSAEDVEGDWASIERRSSRPPMALPPPSGRDVTPTDLAEVRGLFAQLAANHVRQVRDFMLDLRWSDATVDWVGICRPAMRSLRRAADKLELVDLCEALDRFDHALADAQGAGTRTISGTEREALLHRYLELSEVLPQAFALDLDGRQREAVILQSLLLQVPGLKKVAIDKLYAAGVTTLEAIVLATADDLVATTGIDPAVAARIVERFRAYREELTTAVPDATRKHEREQIAALTKRLRQEHDEHERAAESWTRAAEDRKKELRKAREQTLLEINVVLGRLGEIDQLKELERLSFERKLAHLEAFLEEALTKYVAQA